MIEREVIEFVAAADFTDDCQIRIELKEPTAELTITEARAFRTELDRAIAEAERGHADLIREIQPEPVDLIDVHLSPDCSAGKHPTWQDGAWDDDADVEVECQCPCHAAARADTEPAR